MLQIQVKDHVLQDIHPLLRYVKHLYKKHIFSVLLKQTCTVYTYFTEFN